MRSAASYRLALVQLNSTPDIDRNLEQAEAGIYEAAQNGARLIGLPECTPFLGPDELLIEKLSEIESAFFSMMRSLAHRLGIALFAGGYRKPRMVQGSGAPRMEHPPKKNSDETKAHNCLFYVDGRSKQEFLYDKVHLFDVQIPDGMTYEESRYIAPGTEDCSLLKDSPFGNLGFSVCYDLRFPEMYRGLSRAGANVLLIPAAFTAFTGRAHWRTLVRARAIENLSYVFAPAQTGLHFGKRESYGHSMIVAPWGEVLAELGDETGICYAEIDPAWITEARNRIPIK